MSTKIAVTSGTGPPTTHVDNTDATLDSLVHGNGKWANWRVLMNLIIIGFAYGLFGYDNAFGSPLVSLPWFVNKYQGPNALGLYVFTARNLDLIVCIPLVGAAIGTFAAISLQKYFGRRNTFLIAYGLCCIPGSFLQLFAPNLGALVAGRIWNYIGISILTTVAPLYLSEMVPVRDRGRAVGFMAAGAGIASVFATVIVWGTEKLNDSRQYKIPLAVQTAAPAALFALSLLLTESPFWLLINGHLDQARRALASIRVDNPLLVEAELSAAISGLQYSENTTSSTNFWEILQTPHLKRTLTAGALICLSQVGGQILCGTYSTVLLVQSGVADPFKITIIIFLLQFAGTIVGPVLVDKAGRRSVALVGFCILFIIDIAAGGLACAGLKTKPESLGLASLCIIFGFFNSASFQSLSFLLPTEIPTSRLRESTMTWAFFWSYSTAIITTFAVPQLISPDAGNLGAKAFLVFGGCMFLTIIWAYFFLPETKNRTLGEIDEMYEAGIAMRKWRDYKTTESTNAAITVLEQKSTIA